jgi:hypothetical protein
MTLVQTGPGRVSTFPQVPVGGVRATLHNFDIDGQTPKPEHIAFLKLSVIPILAGKNSRIWLQGSASRSGTAVHNLVLSRQRADAVIAILVANGVQRNQIHSDAVGAAMATPHVREAEIDRAVSLLAAPLTVPPPPPPPRPLPPPTASVFKIKLHAALSTGVPGAVGEFLIFQIWDNTNNLTCYYNYLGGGTGRSAGPSLSATLAGPWNEFRTTAPLQVNQFGGAARFTTAGLAWWTSNYLNMMGLPSGVATEPRSLAINTGFTIGLGASTTVGDLKIFDPTPWPFSGP